MHPKQCGMYITMSCSCLVEPPQENKLLLEGVPLTGHAIANASGSMKIVLWSVPE